LTHHAVARGDQCCRGSTRIQRREAAKTAQAAETPETTQAAQSTQTAQAT
jgi:hypothetical protein